MGLIQMIFVFLRVVWVQIAHLVAIDKTRATRPLRTWLNKVAKRRIKRTAAVARRLLVIAYQVSRDEMEYDAGRHTTSPEVRVIRTSRLHIDANDSLDLWTDGERIGQTPATLEAVPNAIRVILHSP